VIGALPVQAPTFPGAHSRARQADIRRATAEGRVWLVLDGMVLDVGRWLPQHPGGATIIPRQALDCDCSRLFEARRGAPRTRRPRGG
jgi:cytochrome b involved in lipid metabolism